MELLGTRLLGALASELVLTRAPSGWLSGAVGRPRCTENLSFELKGKEEDQPALIKREIGKGGVGVCEEMEKGGGENGFFCVRVRWRKKERKGISLGERDLVFRKAQKRSLGSNNRDYFERSVILHVQLQREKAMLRHGVHLNNFCKTVVKQRREETERRDMRPIRIFPPPPSRLCQVP